MSPSKRAALPPAPEGYAYHELAALVETSLRAGLSVLVRGHPGVGKSAMAAQLAAGLDLPLEDIRLAQREPADLGGVYFPDRQRQVLSLFPPDWVRRVCDAPALVFLDEINAAVTRLHQAAAYQIVLERRVGPFRFHPDTRVMAAGNLEEDNAIVTPLSTALRRCNHDSYNLYAEALLKRLAHEVTQRPGTYADGCRIVTSTVERVAGDRSGLHVADGSGMSRLNSVSARALSSWLCDFDPTSEDDAAFIESLPGPGEGTLSKRFKGADIGDATIRAKSGYIRRVSALSGYVECGGGKRYVFSILVNDTERIRPAKRLQERIVTLIATARCYQDS